MRAELVNEGLMKEFLKIDLTEQILISTMYRRLKYVSHPVFLSYWNWVYWTITNNLFLVFPESILFLIPHNRIFSSEH